MSQPAPDTEDVTVRQPRDAGWTPQGLCSECGLSAGEVSVDDVADRAEAAAAEWVQILTSNPAAAARPLPEVWSPLEYGAHVRDVFSVFDARLALTLVENDPVFDNWDQDETAVAEDYASQDPDAVAEELWAAANAFVTRIRSLEPSQLERTARRFDGARFSVSTVLRYVLHDVVHHLWDVTGQQAESDSLP